MGRTYKHNKDADGSENDYTQSDARGSLSVDKRFSGARQTGDKNKSRKKRDKEFRKNRKTRELKINVEQNGNEDK